MKLIFYIDTGIIISQQVPVTLNIDILSCNLSATLESRVFMKLECTHASKAFKGLLSKLIDGVDR